MKFISLAVIVTILVLVPVTLVFWLPVLIAADIDPVQFSLVLESYREQLHAVKILAGTCATAAAGAIVFLVKQMIDSNARTLTEVKAAADARHRDQEARSQEHAATRAMMAKLIERMENQRGGAR